MLLLLRALLYLIAIPIIVIAIIIALSTSNQKAALPQWQLTNSDIQRAQNILYANQQANDNVINLTLTERDLNIACAYLLNLYTDSQSHIQLSADFISFKLAFTLADNLFGRYVDISFQLHIPPFSRPQIKKLQIGKIAIADMYAGFLIEKAIEHTHLNQYLILLNQHLRDIHIEAQQLQLKYQLPASAVSRIQQLLAPPIDARALAQYQEKLATTLSRHNTVWRLSLANLLQPMFALAQQRSTISNAIEENRLAIFVVNHYVNHYQQSPTEQHYYPAYLYRRTDMAQHFMLSASLSAIGNSHLAQIIGQEKELNDAKKGNGFSFIDLAADRAGVYFGKYATASPEQALKIQEKMANIKNYQAFMPQVGDLPERLGIDAFAARYQSIYSPEYQEMLKEIDQRITSSAIYH
ncbi:MAG: hypothetical protein methR_P3257 [Methyloprofundus sp.]|nr:MAG: hypothetical protein methR_P3257 [Methyloprofundus sp.]